MRLKQSQRSFNEFLWRSEPQEQIINDHDDIPWRLKMFQEVLGSKQLVCLTKWFQDIAEKTCLPLTLRTGFFDNCPWCQTATSSVMDVLSSEGRWVRVAPKNPASERLEANLLLFKTVVAVDSWGEIAVPVIQKNPATLFIFVGSLLTLVFGVLNVPRLQWWEGDSWTRMNCWHGVTNKSQ